MADDGKKKTTTNTDDMTMAELRNALSERKLSTTGSIVVLRNRLRKAQSKDGEKKKTDGYNDERADGADGDDDDADDKTSDEEEEEDDVDLLPKDDLKKRLQRLRLKTTGDKTTLRTD